MFEQLMNLYDDVRKSKITSTRYINRYYHECPVNLSLYPKGCFPLLRGHNSLRDAFDDLLLDIRADGVIDPKVLELRNAELAFQDELTYERTLYPSDRYALWAKLQGCTMQEAVRVLSDDIDARTSVLDEANIPKAVTGKFNEEGRFYPFVGLSWSQTLGYQLNLTSSRLQETGSVFVSSRLKQCVGLTNGNPQLPRQDGLPSKTCFDIPSVGFLLSLRDGCVLDVHAMLEDVEVYRRLPMEIMRYALLQVLLAHHNGWQLGCLSLTVTHPYRLGRDEKGYHIAREALLTSVSTQATITLETKKDGLGDYLFEDLILELDDEENNVTAIY